MGEVVEMKPKKGATKAASKKTKKTVTKAASKTKKPTKGKKPKKKKEPALPPKEVAKSLSKALSEGHLDAAKKIATGWLSYINAQDKLAGKRKELKDQMAEANARMRASVERMGEARGSADELEFREAASDVLMAFQGIQEVEAGRKTIIHELLSDRRDAKKKMDQAAKNWRQMELPTT